MKKSILLLGLWIYLLNANSTNYQSSGMEGKDFYQVSIQILFMGGTPPDSALVILGDSSVWTINGLAIFYVENGDYSLSVYAEGYYPFEGGQVYINNAPVTVEIPLYPVLYDVTFYISCCGEPVEGFSLTVDDITCTTGANGTCIFNLPAGAYSYGLGNISGTFTVPDTLYISLEICGEIKFHVTDEQGEPLEEVLINIEGGTLVTDFAGEADTCLQVGFYSYTLIKSGFENQSGSCVVDTVPQTIEIVMLQCLSYPVSFYISGLNCTNQFEGLVFIVNGEFVLPGQTIYLCDGDYSCSLELIDCPSWSFEIWNFQVMGSGITLDLVLPFGITIPQVTFHVTDQFYDDFAGAVINVEDDVLITDNSGEASFCMTGGYHDYWVANPGYDTIPNNFIFPCQDITIEVMLMIGSIGKEKMIQSKIYPNPSDGKFYLETTGSDNDLFVLQVVDLTGRIVYEIQPAISERYEIDLSGQQKGMYFLRVKAGKVVANRKMIVQ
jgi:hypothetical protein